MKVPFPRALASAVAVLALAVASTSVTRPASAQVTSQSEATVLGARWLAAQLTPEGYVEGLFSPGPDPDATRDVAFTLAATGLEEDAFALALSWLTANIEEVIAPESEPDGPGTLGVLIMIAVATGEDPTNFGGVNLITRLNGTLGLLEPGLFGASDPTFDGVLRQSLALLGLDAAGASANPAAITWLEDQQCVAGESAPESLGGFPAYRNPAVPCPAPDVMNYAGAETDATAVALQWLVRNQGSSAPRTLQALEFLGTIQSATGGFPWYAGDVDSTNSTALAIGGLLAVGGQDGAAQAAIAWLEDQQLGCDSPDAGAFTSSYSDGAADQFATRQAVLGVAGVTVPLGLTAWSSTSDPCAPPGPGPEPSPSPAPIVAPVAPKFTG